MASGPFPIELSTVPIAQFDPNSKLERGWGMDGPKRIRSRISEAEADRLRAEALNLEPSAQLAAMREAGPTKQAPSAGVAFDSLDISDCCGGSANVPPDPELAVGPNHIIAVVNVAFEIYDKSGTLLQGPTTFSSFFAGTTGCTSGGVFDPNVLYDEENDRFILGIDGDGTDYCVAAAQTADPLGAWNRYGFQTNFGGAFFDYPHAGVGVDAIYMGSNQFGGSVPGGFEGRVFAMDRAALMSGAALTVVTHSTGMDGTPQPMNTHGWNQGTWPASATHYIMTEVFDGANHTVWSWDDPFGANTFVRQADLNLVTSTGVAAGFPLDQPQLGGQPIQGNDWRGLDTEYRNGFIWMTGTISCNPGSGSVNCVRWAQIDPTVPSIVDSGVLSSNGDYRSFPDLAVNDCGDMAVGYTKTSASTWPGIWVTGREAGDAPGTVQAETQLKAGEIAYTAFDSVPRRWGDYTGMTIDPDGQTFWYLGEYSKNTGNPNGRWGTYIGSFSYAACGGGGGSDIAGTVTGVNALRAICRNGTTGQVISGAASGDAWNCSDLGLTASTGDRVLQEVRSLATSGAIGGTVEGVQLERVLCRNLDTGANDVQNVSGNSWTCNLGATSAGHRILQRLVGDAD
jgi:hypothetical protein